MDMFTREEAFSFIKDKLGVEDAEQRMKTDKRALLDNLVSAIQECIPFQNIRLLSIPPQERCRQQTLEEIKADFVAGIGGLCFNINVSGFFLFKAIGFDVCMAHASVTTSVTSADNHVILYVSNVEKAGDKFVVELAVGFPTFQAISLDFETESPIYVSSYIEYRYAKHDGKILRMHRKGDHFANRNRVQDPELDLWIGDFRRLYYADPEGSTDFSEFDKCNKEIFVDPKASPFHLSFRCIIFKGRKSSMVINEKTLIEDSNGELEANEIAGGDEGVVTTINQMCPNIPEDLIRKALVHWRQTLASKK